MEDKKEAFFEAKKRGAFGEDEDDGDDAESEENEEERGEKIANDTKIRRKSSARAETHPLTAPCHHKRQYKWSGGRQSSGTSSSAVMPLFLPVSSFKNSGDFFKSFRCCGREKKGPDWDAEVAAGKSKASWSAAVAVTVRRMAVSLWKKGTIF